MMQTCKRQGRRAGTGCRSCWQLAGRQRWRYGKAGFGRWGWCPAPALWWGLPPSGPKTDPVENLYEHTYSRGERICMAVGMLQCSAFCCSICRWYITENPADVLTAPKSSVNHIRLHKENMHRTGCCHNQSGLDALPLLFAGACSI